VKGNRPCAGRKRQRPEARGALRAAEEKNNGPR
jgi:hypothetical protein